MKKQRLGRGLEALIETHEDQEKVQEISLDLITPNPYQPRIDFNQDKMEELTQSIREFGLIQPITLRNVMDSSEKCYQIVVGERRWRAAKQAQLKTLPAFIKEIDEKTMMEMAMVENLQREDLNPIEEARAFHVLMENFSLTQESLSAKIGKSRSAIANSIRLLNLSPVIQENVSRETISPGHARALLAIKDHLQQEKFLKKIVRYDLSVRQTEKLVKEYLQPVERREVKGTSFLNYEKELNDLLESPVQIREGKRDKKIIIQFKDEDDLKKVVKRIRG